MMLFIIALVLASYLAYHFYQRFFPSPNIKPKDKYVLISGCDSGFGHGLAIELDKQGFHVLAGIYMPENEESLRNTLSSQATVFHFDITRQEDIDAEYELVKDKTNTLHALVNNTGVLSMGFIDWTSLESIRRIIDTNFFGHVDMTKQFMPLLIAKRDSRVVNTGSILVCITVPASMSYCVSKYAIESFSDCLRYKMAPWGLRVSIIEPGSMKTYLLNGHERALSNMWASLPFEVKER